MQYSPCKKICKLKITLNVKIRGFLFGVMYMLMYICFKLLSTRSQVKTYETLKWVETKP